MPKAKTYWLCSFCSRKKWIRKSLTEKHESNCYKNPDRVPYLGELTFIGQTGKIVDYGYDDSINGQWLEWNEHDEMPKWWPGDAGMIWNGGQWLKVPGYKTSDALPGHGCAGGAPSIEEWPMLDERPLNEHRAATRLLVFGKATGE